MSFPYRCIARTYMYIDDEYFGERQVANGEQSERQYEKTQTAVVMQTRVWNVERDCRGILSRSPTVAVRRRTVAATSILVAWTPRCDPM